MRRKWGGIYVARPDVLLVLLCASALRAQQVRADFVPDFTLEVSSHGEPLTANLPSPMIKGTIGCMGDGSLIVHSFMPYAPSKPDDQSMKLSVISPAGHIQGFDLRQITDIKQVQNASLYDIGSQEVVILVASGDTSSEEKKNPDERWVAKFDRQGAYKGSSPLNLHQLDISKIAVFDNGDLLLLGVDRINREPVIARYSTSSQTLLPFQLVAPLVKENPNIPSALAPGDPHHGHSDVENYYKIKGALDASQLVHYKNTILVMQRDVGAQIYQLFENGSLNRIVLPTKQDFTVDSLIGSDDSIYVRYRRNGSNLGRSDDAYILEISPTTGQVLRKIHTAGSTVWDVACVHNQVFKVNKLKGEQTFQFFDAIAQPTQ